MKSIFCLGLRRVYSFRMVNVMKALKFIWAFSFLFLVSCETITEISRDMQDMVGTAVEVKPLADKASERLIADGSCPDVEVVEDLAMIYHFVQGQETIPANMIGHAKISDTNTQCSYGLRSVTMDVGIHFVSELGARSEGRTSFDHPFFVAVTTASGKILEKEVFASNIMHAGGSVTQNYHQDVRQIIPLKDGQDGADYKVLVGFQASPDQLQFNRELLFFKTRVEGVEKRTALEAAQKRAEDEAKVLKAVRSQVVSSP